MPEYNEMFLNYTSDSNQSCADFNLQDMLNTIRKFPPAPPSPEVHVNAEMLRQLKEQLPVPVERNADFIGIGLGDMLGVPIYQTLKDVEEWEPTPWGPFANLEKSDECWARPLGLGRIVKKPSAFMTFHEEFQKDWGFDAICKRMGVPASILHSPV